MISCSAYRCFMTRLTLFLGLLFFVGCGPRACSQRQDVAPEEQLRSYIDLAVNITRMEQREELEDYTTGEFRDKITSASPEAFKKSYLDRRYEFDEFEVTSKTEVVAEKETHLEYRVKFRTWLAGEDKSRAPLQEIKSIAVMKYTNGHWAIATINPVDTAYNWDVGLPMEGVSTQGVTEDSPFVDPNAESPEQNTETQKIEGQSDGAQPASAPQSPPSPNGDGKQKP